MSETSTPTSSRESIELSYEPERGPLRRRLGWAFRGWARSTFSRESFISSFKSLLWVVPLTALIWIYAEREEDATVSQVPVVLDVRSSDPRTFVKLASATTVHVNLAGRQVDVEQVKDWLQTTPVSIEVAPNLSPGQHQIPLRIELNQLSRLKSKGVSISECDPAEATVDVDEFQTVELEVRARPEDSKTLGSPIFNPARVKISAPQRLLRQAEQDSGGHGLVAYANFASFKQALAEPGKHSFSAVPVVPSIAIADARPLQPAVVSADVDVTDTGERTIALKYLRVLAAMPSDAGARADQYKPVFEATLTGITVSGPEQQIALLQDPNYAFTPPPAAIFEVNYSDIDNPAPAPLMFQLPKGVHVTEQEAQMKINYSFKPRSAEAQ